MFPKEADMATGDHLKVRRWGLLYAHHGIDLGDGTVIHFAEPDKDGQRAEVRQTDLDEFLQGGRAIVVDYPPGQALPPEETVDRAKSQLGRVNYDLAWNNCEHFATWAKTGRKKSNQVLRAVVGAASAALLIAVTIIGRGRRS